MAVILVPKFTKEQIKQMLRARMNRISEAVLSRLQFIGEQFVANARTKANFKDRTGNLRSSIGYVILKNGRQVFQNFQEVNGGNEGPKAAKKVIQESRKNFPKGYVLIGVAGMEYAAAVESLGYDVITSSSIIAEQAMVQAIKNIQEKVGKLT